MKPKNTLEKYGILRPDFLFSYWIIGWTLIYYFTDTTTTIGKILYHWFNPIFALLFALLENIVTFIFILLYNPKTDLILKYVSMTALLKVFPIYLLRNHPVNWARTFFAFLLLFLMYNLYLYANETDVVEVYKRTFTSNLKDKPDTPLFWLYSNAYSFFG